jgi:hypothetical protein
LLNAAAVATTIADFATIASMRILNERTSDFRGQNPVLASKQLTKMVKVYKPRRGGSL